jgi:murein L,D-transpeptidase YcbB/YkuD
MKKMLPLYALLALAPLAASASSVDTIGGADGNAQTIHHCGYLKSSAKLYTSSPVTVGIIEHKLANLGYKSTLDGNYSKRDKSAVKAFQRDYGLAVDGIVGPITAQHLAQASHPSPNVRRCHRPALAQR